MALQSALPGITRSSSSSCVVVVRCASSVVRRSSSSSSWSSSGVVERRRRGSCVLRRASAVGRLSSSIFRRASFVGRRASSSCFGRRTSRASCVVCGVVGVVVYCRRCNASYVDSIKRYGQLSLIRYSYTSALALKFYGNFWFWVARNFGF